MKIALLVIENRETVKKEYAKFLVKMAWERKVEEIRFWYETKPPIWYMRREMIKDVLKETDCTHILFVDTDVIPKEGFLEKLIAHNVPLVSGVYYDMMGYPVNRKGGQPLFFSQKGLLAVDTFAMGLSLIRRDVLEKVEYPLPVAPQIADADIEFCRKAREAGYKVFCDFGIQAYHILSIPIDHKFMSIRINEIIENRMRDRNNLDYFE